MNYNKLTPEEERIIVYKATEAPFSGKYDNFYEDGTFICTRCNAPLFSSKSKFDSGCGWPSFDESFQNAIKRVPDPDGMITATLKLQQSPMDVSGAVKQSSKDSKVSNLFYLAMQEE